MKPKQQLVGGNIAAKTPNDADQHQILQDPPNLGENQGGDGIRGEYEGRSDLKATECR